MNICRVEPEDLKKIEEIEKLCFKTPWSLLAFESELMNSDAIFLKAVLDSKIVGYIIIRKIVDELHIMNIAVEPTNRKKGIAQELLNYIFNNLSSGKLMLLEVRKSNIAAIELYKKNGFNGLHVRKAYYSDGEDAVVMVREAIKE